MGNGTFAIMRFGHSREYLVYPSLGCFGKVQTATLADISSVFPPSADSSFRATLLSCSLMSRRAESLRNNDVSAGDRLEQFLRSNACILYEEMKDREYPQVACFVYGVPKTNELFVRVTNGIVSFVEAVPSPVSFPIMADRIFGIDAADSTAALELAEELWNRHRGELLRGPAR